MSLNKVDGGALVPSAYQEQARDLVRKERVMESRTPTNHSSEPERVVKPKPKQGDVAEISTDARRMVDLHTTYAAGRAALDRTPDTRADVLARVRERLATGFYNSVEVRERVAARVAEVVRDLDSF
jgi:hypothetical protein